MQTIHSIADLRARVRDRREGDHVIALVPTLGALHAGHSSLIRLAAEHADTVIVSIFVNPTQFGPNEDFAKYPRDLKADQGVCLEAGADVVFAPSVEDMYPKGFSTYVIEDHVSKPLEGASRPTHFRGVTTVVAKLLNIVAPDIAVFGQKDSQQVAVIRKMIADLLIPVEVIVGPTVREPDGLAMSSRNRYLSPSQRKEAVALYQALTKAREMVAQGEHRSDRLIAEATHILSQHRRVRVIYVAVTDSLTMEPVREAVGGKSMMAVAAWVDEVRLIDNILL
ncbi:MAG TPA: pantoate--beta-alanine ligase [Opitutaceae bacterium]|nr:pantoate--beta-alanine ligase [Opitutaceae bacterium]